MAIERVILKVFSKYSIDTEVTEQIRSTFKTKLWRMGNKLSKIGGLKHLQVIDDWKNSFWPLTIVDMGKRLMFRKRSLEKSLENEVSKRLKLEADIQELRKKRKEQENVITTLQKENKKGRGSSSKIWNDYSARHQRAKCKEFVTTALSIVNDRHFVPQSVEVTHTDSGKREVIDLDKGTFVTKANSSQSVNDDITGFALYVKDKFLLSDAAYRELSQLTLSLPRLNSLKKLSTTLNSEFDLFPAPNGVIGVQQRLKTRLLACLNSFGKLGENDVVQVKLTGDGTNIGCTFHVINVAFVLLNDMTSVSSPKGNHSLAILDVAENYESLRLSLSDILQEASELQSIQLNGRSHCVEYYLGGDMKFLALVCGIQSANGAYSCVWCKCRTIDRWDMVCV